MTMAAKKGMVLSSVATHSLCKYIFKNCENVTCAELEALFRVWHHIQKR